MGGCAEPAADDDDVTGEPDGVVIDAAIRVEEAAALSAIVTWSTGEAATSAVEVAVDGELLHSVGDDVARVDHEVVVIGLHPESSYQLTAVSRTGDGEVLRSPPLDHTTGSLPIPALGFEVDVQDPDAMQPGWTLLNVVTGGADEAVRLLLMIDRDGRPVWSYRIEGVGTGRGDIVATLEDGDTVVVGGGMAPGSPLEVDLAGRILWEGPHQEDAEFMVPGQMHHAFERLDNGNYVTLEWAFDGGVYDVIREFDADHQTVWEWDFRSGVPEEDSYVWCNAVQVDLEGDAAYLNGMSKGLLYKIDRASGDVIWTLGKHGDFTNPQDVEYPFAWGSHGVDRLPDGNVLFYDNGHDSRGESRVAEWSLDEDAMVAQIVFEYPGEGVDDHFNNPVHGDADRLDNGNTLVVAGGTYGESTPARLFELDPDGDKVWQAWFTSSDPDLAFGAYAAERVPVLVE